MKIGIIDLCKQIEDPRMNRKKVHKIPEFGISLE